MLPYSTCYYFMYETIKKSYCRAQKKESLSRAEMLLVGAFSGKNLESNTLSPRFKFSLTSQWSAICGKEDWYEQFCISTMSFFSMAHQQVSLNHKGSFRQGDPLSHFLFLLAMEKMSRGPCLSHIQVHSTRLPTTFLRWSSTFIPSYLGSMFSKLQVCHVQSNALPPNSSSAYVYLS